MRHIEKVDPEVAKIITAEQQRQSETLEMIASENHTSAAVIEAMGTALTDKYAEGYPRKRWYCGCENADLVEQLAIDRAKELFGFEHANVQPHSGTSANTAVYLAALKAGDKIMGMDLAHGGHLSHGHPMNISGKLFEVVSYGVSEDHERLDMDKVRQQVLAEKPAMLVTGASAYPRTIDFEAFGQIAKEAGCLLLSDIAHIAGLVAAGVHPSATPHSDFVTATTHKTLRGPRGGLVGCTEEWAKKIDTAVFPGTQGGPLVHVVAAKAVSFHEDLQPAFKEYAKAVLNNARTLADELSAKGWRLVSGGTENHLLLIDLRSRMPDVTGHDGANWLASAGIVANKNAIPFETRSPFKASGIRFGTPGITTRGIGTEEVRQIAGWIDEILTSNGDGDVIDRIRGAVREMAEQFPVPNAALQQA